MAAGKHSPIVEAIQKAETLSTGEIRVHLSKRFIEKDPYARAQQLFREMGMFRTSQRNGVLLYVNLRKRKFAVIGDVGVHHAVGQQFWEKLVRELREDLLSTHTEKAIAQAVTSIGKVLAKHFPAEADQANPDELPNDVTEG